MGTEPHRPDRPLKIAGRQASERRGSAFWLAKAGFRDQPAYMRTWRPYRRAIVLILAVFVAAGMSLSFAQAARMSVGMIVMSDMGAGNDNCSGCPGNADDGSTAMPCWPVCVTPVLAVLPQDPAGLSAIQASELPSLPSAPLHGQTSLPDPSPPRPGDLV